MSQSGVGGGGSDGGGGSGGGGGGDDIIWQTPTKPCLSSAARYRKRLLVPFGPLMRWR